MHVLVVPNPSHLLHHGQVPRGPADSPMISVVQAQGKGSHKATQNAGETGFPPDLIPPARFSFPSEGKEGSGETLLHGAMLAWGVGSAAATFTLLM